MIGVIKNYRRGRNTQHENQYIVEIEGVETKAKASILGGKKVAWTSPAKKIISGSITAAHGSSGAVRVKFSRGLPGQAIGTRVRISE